MTPPVTAPGPAPVAWPRGFRFASGHCGVKRKASDLMLVTMDPPAAAAAVFTTNRLQAAPVRLSRAHLQASGGRVRAFLVNSGNANCATGAAGRRAALAMARTTARLLHCPVEQVLVGSTGVIGQPLPVEKILAALPRWLDLVSPLGAGDEREPASGRPGAQPPSKGGASRTPLAAAHAIRTTDTCAKIAGASFRDGGRTYRIAGMAKGSGMIHPRMATMFGFLFTDAPLTPAACNRALRRAVDASFHRISVDGDTSTNDTATLFASGSGRPLSPQGAQAFQAALIKVAQALARQIVLDGEGARHFVTLEVEGARSFADADTVARALAHSPLVKTALAGADANWGRVLSTAGWCGVPFLPERASIWFSRVPVYLRGAVVPFDEAEVKHRLERREVVVRLHLGAGRARAWMWTCDLTEGYIRINGAYRT
ncbi:MAG: bifunctional glutamate N-acetyltransferase/amino-acid acetyltransferase ArgJ [Terriglobales bacterium]